jgi:hypothetical protein
MPMVVADEKRTIAPNLEIEASPNRSLVKASYEGRGKIEIVAEIVDLAQCQTGGDKWLATPDSAAILTLLPPAPTRLNKPECRRVSVTRSGDALSAEQLAYWVGRLWVMSGDLVGPMLVGRRTMAGMYIERSLNLAEKN